MSNKQGVGTGLSSLLGASKRKSRNRAAESHSQPPIEPNGERLVELDINIINRGDYQPRRHFNPELLQELADSIASGGLIQPILVRMRNGGYELIAGERRWRASKLAGLNTIPAIVRELDDRTVAAVSLIENIQRADLNPLEEAEAFHRLCTEFKLTHQVVADKVGRSRVAVTNLMRLLELHDEVKGLVNKGALEMGHARALLGAPLDDQPTIANRILQSSMTVRGVEKLIKNIREGVTTKHKLPTEQPPHLEQLRHKLATLTSAPVNVWKAHDGTCKVSIEYHSVSNLETIINALENSQRETNPEHS